MTSTGNIPLGIFLTLIGAMMLALGMVLQRYGLSYPVQEVPMPFGKKLSRNKVWIIGFLTYFGGNGLYALALPLAPLSLLAGIFTTLLIFNIIFAYKLMKEPLTKYKLAGAGVIIFGVVLCVCSTPSGVPTEFTSDQISEYLNSARGLSWILLLVVLILSTAYSIHWFERTYYKDEDIAKEGELVLDLFDDMVEEVDSPEPKKNRLPRFLRSLTRAYEVHDRIQVMQRKKKVLENHSALGFSLFAAAGKILEDQKAAKSGTLVAVEEDERLPDMSTHRSMDGLETQTAPASRLSIHDAMATSPRLPKATRHSLRTGSSRGSPRRPMGRTAMDFSRTRTMVDILTDSKKLGPGKRKSVIMDAVAQILTPHPVGRRRAHTRGSRASGALLAVPTPLRDVPEDQVEIMHDVELEKPGRKESEGKPSSTRKRKKKMGKLDMFDGEYMISDEEDDPAGAKKGNESADELSENEREEPPPPPEWQLRIMSLVYPGSLGIDEGLGLLAMKGVVAVLAAGNWWASGIFWFMLLTWGTCALGTLWWLRVVFARYETTKALPIEYGMVNVMQVLSGLVFFREDQYYKTWQLILLFIGVFVILCGVQVGRMEDPAPEDDLADLITPVEIEHEHEAVAIQIEEPKSSE